MGKSTWRKNTRFGKLQPGFLDGFGKPLKDQFPGTFSENKDILTCVDYRGHSFASSSLTVFCASVSFPLLFFNLGPATS